jgi:hypothetical protein
MQINIPEPMNKTAQITVHNYYYKDCLKSGLVLTEYNVPPKAAVLAHYTGVAATSFMPGITVVNGGVSMRLSKL